MSLILNIFAYYISGNFITYTSNKISIAPKFPRPKLFPQLRELPEYLACRYTFHYLCGLGWRISGWYLNKIDLKVLEANYALFHHALLNVMSGRIASRKEIG
jgi:hypothetical protein